MIDTRQAIESLAKLYKIYPLYYKELHAVEEYILQLEADIMVLNKQIKTFADMLDKAIIAREEVCD